MIPNYPKWRTETDPRALCNVSTTRLPWRQIVAAYHHPRHTELMTIPQRVPLGTPWNDGETYDIIERYIKESDPVEIKRKALEALKKAAYLI